MVEEGRCCEVKLLKGKERDFGKGEESGEKEVIFDYKLYLFVYFPHQIFYEDSSFEN